MGQLRFALFMLLFLYALMSYQIQADAPDNDLITTTSTYLASPQDDELNGVVIDGQGGIWVAGAVEYNFGLTPNQIDGGGSGTLLQLAERGQTPTTITHFPTTLLDIGISQTDNTIAVVSADAVYRLDEMGETAVWQHPLPATDRYRVDVSPNGTVAVLATPNSSTNGERLVRVYAGSDGTELGAFTVEIPESGQLFDIALSDSLVYVVGFRQVASTLKLPLVRAYSYDGTVQWSAYNYTANQASNQGDNADSEAKVIAFGADGQLYVAGRTDGGNNIFRRDPFDIDQNGNNISFDNFTNTSNINSGSFGYFTRLDPITGAQDAGQYVLTRLMSGGYRGNSFGINAISADENGQVYLAGGAYFAVPCRTPETVAIGQLCPSGQPLRINGQAVGSYTSNEGAVLAIAPDLQSRELVAVWAGAGTVTSSAVQGVAVRDGLRAMVATSNDGGNLLTFNAVQPSPRSGSNGFMAVWQDPTQPTAPIALPDVATAVAGQSTLISPLSNDTDANRDDALTLVGVTDGALGTAVMQNNHVLYTPNANAEGTETLSYTVTDGTLQTEGTITVTIADVLIYLPVIIR